PTLGILSSRLGFVFTVQWFRLGGGVAHYLTRRYIYNLNPAYIKFLLPNQYTKIKLWSEYL
ncbi:hypothetical protein, partial [Vibrio gallaecicus]